MRETLCKLAAHPEEVRRILTGMDRAALERGTLTLTPAMLNAAAAVFSGPDLRIGEITPRGDGWITVRAETGGGLKLTEILRPERLTLRNGTLSGSLLYREERQGGGLGKALLNVSGRSALSVALAGRQGIRVEGDRISLDCRGLPAGLSAEYVRTDGAGITLRIR